MIKTGAVQAIKTPESPPAESRSWFQIVPFVDRSFVYMYCKAHNKCMQMTKTGAVQAIEIPESPPVEWRACERFRFE